MPFYSMEKAGCQAKRIALFAHVWKTGRLPAQQKFALRHGLPKNLTVVLVTSLKSREAQILVVSRTNAVSVYCLYCNISSLYNINYRDSR